jgi:threonine dehydrogenase-like Zn-dependent dehydrogenase
VGADAVFICVRNADVIRQAEMIVRKEGTIAIIGFPKPVELDPIFWLNKHLRVIGCEPFLRYNLQAMRLMEYKRVNCKSLVSEIMPLNEVNKAFDSLYQGDNLLVMLKP